MNFDAIIVGGGPAGSTLAGMLLKYRPESQRIRRMQVPVAMGELFPLIDGDATLTQIGDTFVAKRDIDPAHRGSLNRYILWIAQSLVDRDLATCITPRADAS
jgi:hypothetical protein